MVQSVVKINIGRSVHDPTNPIGRLLSNVLAMIAQLMQTSPAAGRRRA